MVGVDRKFSVENLSIASTHQRESVTDRVEPGSECRDGIPGGYLAVNWEATVDEVAEFIQPHPSLSELFGETVLSLTGRSLNA